MNSVTTLFDETCAELNPKLSSGFYLHQEAPGVKRTHFFNGRYENIYLDTTHIPELGTLIDQACYHASQILNQPNLQASCWFNHMPPGSLTLPHRHDDDDELLSAAYYIDVPKNSGDLVIQAGGVKQHITPRPGTFIFFAPDVVHEVTKNCSNQHRLSLGINFGRKRSPL